MKKFIICLGLGKNQLNFVKKIDNSFSIIGIDIKFPVEAKKKDRYLLQRKFIQFK